MKRPNASEQVWQKQVWQKQVWQKQVWQKQVWQSQVWQWVLPGLAIGMFAMSCAQGIGDTEEERCPEGLTRCRNECIDISSHDQHCGSCNSECEVGTLCNGQGSCALSCQDYLTECGGACVDVMFQRAHCGACDQACPPSHVCSQGVCEVTCLEGLVKCDGECINPLTNATYCGVDEFCFGTPCQKGHVCDGTGTCARLCASDYVECNSTCINPEVNDAFCGVTGDCQDNNAGTPCGPGFRCESGECVVSCPPTTVLCGDTCIDPLNHPDFCGAQGDCVDANAGVDCAANEACVSGTCEDLGCLPVRPGFLGGEVGPTFSDGCWSQCAGYLDADDAAPGDQIPAAWGDHCKLPEDNLLRVVCGNAAGTIYRYIDVSKNVFRDLLASNPEDGLITDARDQDNIPFVFSSNQIFAANSDPNTSDSRWGGAVGCDGTSASLLVNTAPGTCREVANCFGLAPQLIGSDAFLGIYVQE